MSSAGPTDVGPPPRRATLRLGARERTRLQAIVIGVIIALLAIALRPLVAHLVEVRDFQGCQTNVRKIAQALIIYTQEWDDAYPSATVWLDAVRGNLAPTTGTGFATSHYLRCPADPSQAPSSYVYNALMAGLSQSVRQTEPDKSARRRMLRRLDRAALVVEKHGSAYNQSVSLADWNAVQAAMDRPHHLPEGTGSLIMGSGRAWYRTDAELAALAGRRF